MELPSAQVEESIDNNVRSMLCVAATFVDLPEENKPWILDRLLFGSGLLQPCNLRLLEVPELSDPAHALRFILLEEWHNSGRDFWPLVCDTIEEPNKHPRWPKAARAPAGRRSTSSGPLTQVT